MSEIEQGDTVRVKDTDITFEVKDVLDDGDIIVTERMGLFNSVSLEKVEVGKKEMVEQKKEKLEDG